MKNIILLTLVLVMFQFGFPGIVKAQVDPHFSQYYANPLWLNPALTGVIDGNARINANVKNQWTGIPNSYKTGALSADFRLNDRTGLGVNILNQSAGTAGYNYFAAYGSYGYNITISNDGMQKLHFGIQAGLINRSFDPSKQQFDDQYNPIGGYNPNTPSFEDFATTNATVFDAGAGIFYYDANTANKANVFAGLSFAHLTSPKDPFTNGTIQGNLPVRFTAHAGIKIKASANWDVIPNAIYISQRANNVKALGIYSELKFKDDNGLILGGMYRFGDAAVANVGYHLKKLVIGLSYDFNTSALRSATNGQGGFELSLVYIFSKGPVNQAGICPRF